MIATLNLSMVHSYSPRYPMLLVNGFNQLIHLNIIMIFSWTHTPGTTISSLY